MKTGEKKSHKGQWFACGAALVFGEYKQGLPWNGFLPRSGKSKYPKDWGYFIKGNEVNYSDYCRHCGKTGPNHRFYGLNYLGQGK